MEQIAFDVLETLKWRYAVKKFDTKRLPEETVATILEAGNLTASSYGLQPWRILVVENPELRAAIKEHAWGQTQVVDASHLLVICRQTELTEQDITDFTVRMSQARNIPVEELEPYRQMMLSTTVQARTPEALAEWMAKQSYIVLGNLLAACAALGVDSVPMEGFSAEAVDQVLGLKEKGLASVTMLPIGYRSEQDPFAGQAKVRRPLEEVVRYI